MTASAYVLVEIAPSFDKKGVFERIIKISGVKRADTVTGPYDIILFGEAEGIPALEKIFSKLFLRPWNGSLFIAMTCH